MITQEPRRHRTSVKDVHVEHPWQRHRQTLPAPLLWQSHHSRGATHVSTYFSLLYYIVFWRQSYLPLQNYSHYNHGIFCCIAVVYGVFIYVMILVCNAVDGYKCWIWECYRAFVCLFMHYKDCICYLKLYIIISMPFHDGLSSVTVIDRLSLWRVSQFG